MIWVGLTGYCIWWSRFVTLGCLDLQIWGGFWVFAIRFDFRVVGFGSVLCWGCFRGWVFSFVCLFWICGWVVGFFFWVVLRWVG